MMLEAFIACKPFHYLWAMSEAHDYWWCITVMAADPPCSFGRFHVCISLRVVQLVCALLNSWLLCRRLACFSAALKLLKSAVRDQLSRICTLWSQGKRRKNLEPCVNHGFRSGEHVSRVSSEALQSRITKFQYDALGLSVPVLRQWEMLTVCGGGPTT